MSITPNMNKTLTDDEYEKLLWDLLKAAEDVDAGRKQYRQLERRRDSINTTIVSFLKNAIDAEQMGYEYSDKEGRKYRYNVNFRIPADNNLNKYKTMGFFFDANHGWSGFRVKDYSNIYRNLESGPSKIFLVMDYAEDIIDKARKRMRLSKYRAKYDLSPLIDVLHTLSVLRGGTYFIREGTPPKKFSAKEAVDPVTGKKRKVRAKSGSLNVPFKIKKVHINVEG